jgi:hypothetical protein
VPLFAELREELDRHFLLDDTVGSEFVIQGLQGTSWVLYEPFRKISDLAGLGTIKSPFVNMRRSRSNEVRRQFGEAKERAWIGHSQKVAEKHYQIFDDEEYAEAAEVNLGDKKTHAKSHAVGCGTEAYVANVR